MAKKITLKNKAGEVLCPHTAIEQVQGLKEALDKKLGKTEKAASATKADTASYANATREPNNHTYSTRRTTANVHYNADGGLHYFLATGSITDNSAPEGHIIHCDWDNNPNSWLAQLLIKHGPNNGLLRRYKQYSTDSWSGWITMLDDKNFDKYALPLTGGTLTGSITAPTYKGATDKSGVYSEAIMSYTSAFANNDLNSERFLKAGMYRLDGVNDTINQPGGRGFGHLMTIRGGNSDNAAQMFFDYFDNGNAYIRTGSTNPNAGDFYILNRAWKQLLEDLVTTSHIADAAITPAKIQTSIALNGTPSMTVEPTTSSPDRTIASVGLVKKAVENIEIGGTNLILNSDFSEGTEHWTNIYWGTTISSEENILKVDIQKTANQFGVNASPISLESGQQYIVSFDVKSDGITSLDYCYLRSSSGNIRLPSINGVTSEWQRLECKFTSTQIGIYNFSFGAYNLSTEIAQSIEFRKVKLERGNKATDWSPAPEDVQANISNAETRSKAHAEDYTNDAIDKIENGQTVAQKANSLYDADSNKYKNWGEIDTAITRKIGNKFEDYATKSYVQGEISKQVAVPIASETEDGKVKLATPEDVTAVENDNSAVNNSAKAVTPYTLKEYIASKNFATDSDISSAVTAAKPTIFYQAAQPAGGKDGDIWIIP